MNNICIWIFSTSKKLLAYTYPFDVEVGMQAFCMSTQSSWVWDGEQRVDAWASMLLQWPQWRRGEKWEKGDKWDNGETGKNGKDGKDGRDGANGRNGSDGKDGEVGPMWPQGGKGDKWENGRDGKDGRDGSMVHSADEWPVEWIWVNNDLRINKKTGEIYIKSWKNRQFIHNIKQ